MEHRRNNIVRGKPKYFEKSLFPCHFVHHKSYKDWCDIEPLFFLLPKSLFVASTWAVAVRKACPPYAGACSWQVKVSLCPCTPWRQWLIYGRRTWILLVSVGKEKVKQSLLLVDAIVYGVFYSETSEVKLSFFRLLQDRVWGILSSGMSRRPLGIWPPTFRDNVAVAFGRVEMFKMNYSWNFGPLSWKFLLNSNMKMRPQRRLETSDTAYPVRQRHIPVGGPKYCIFYTVHRGSVFTLSTSALAWHPETAAVLRKRYKQRPLVSLCGLCTKYLSSVSTGRSIRV
jgi:hypothetical protein